MTSGRASSVSRSDGQAGASAFLAGLGRPLPPHARADRGRAARLGHIGWRADGPEALSEAVGAAGGGGRRRRLARGVPRTRPRLPLSQPGRPPARGLLGGRALPAPAGDGLAVPEPSAALPSARRRVRCIDHVTICAADPLGDAEWYRDTLGHRFMEYTVIPDRPDFPVFAMTTVCERAHDLGIVWDPTARAGTYQPRRLLR